MLESSEDPSLSLISVWSGWLQPLQGHLCLVIDDPNLYSLHDFVVKPEELLSSLPLLNHRDLEEVPPPLIPH